MENLAKQVIGAAIEVHRHLGPGLKESVYMNALCHELSLRGIPFDREVSFEIRFKGLTVGQGRMDLVVSKRLVVEGKSVDELARRDRLQTLYYMRHLKEPLGLLLNFNGAMMKEGVKRVLDTEE
ncbi:MAG: GxxExxY protein [Planctomycetes bacterium]|nr:GxxExxY protein [Planctomycetota bacterium]